MRRLLSNKLFKFPHPGAAAIDSGCQYFCVIGHGYERLGDYVYGNIKPSMKFTAVNFPVDKLRHVYSHPFYYVFRSYQIAYAYCSGCECRRPAWVSVFVPPQLLNMTEKKSFFGTCLAKPLVVSFRSPVWQRRIRNKLNHTTMNRRNADEIGKLFLQRNSGVADKLVFSNCPVNCVLPQSDANGCYGDHCRNRRGDQRLPFFPNHAGLGGADSGAHRPIYGRSDMQPRAYANAQDRSTSEKNPSVPLFESHSPRVLSRVQVVERGA